MLSASAVTDAAAMFTGACRVIVELTALPVPPGLTVIVFTPAVTDTGWLKIAVEFTGIPFTFASAAADATAPATA
jgi:hypothetical protein